jgi:hypothetical protein
MCSRLEPLDNSVVQQAIILLFKMSVLCCLGAIKRTTNLIMPKVDDQEFERVREFKYFGYDLTEYNSITIEIK